VARCHTLGLIPVLAEHARERRGYLAGTDAQRLADFQLALRDPGIDAIWAVRGGYGTLRFLAHLDLAPLLERPKPIIGFSDNTALHLALRRAGLVSFHGPHAGAAFPDFTLHCFTDVLFHTRPAGVLPRDPAAEAPVALSGGTAEGRLAGGNLTLLAACCGTPFALDAGDAIVVMEDVNEPAYRLDRAFTQLKLAGCLEGARGLAFGRFNWTDGDAPPGPAAPSNEPAPLDVIADTVGSLGIPIVTGFPFGHIDRQWCLPLGVRARLDADSCALEILEPAVT
jgi:muramoyltetrapeptide carboxypeptidase